MCRPPPRAAKTIAPGRALRPVAPHTSKKHSAHFTPAQGPASQPSGGPGGRRGSVGGKRRARRQQLYTPARNSCRSVCRGCRATPTRELIRSRTPRRWRDLLFRWWAFPLDGFTRHLPSTSCCGLFFSLSSLPKCASRSEDCRNLTQNSLEGDQLGYLQNNCVTFCFFFRHN